MARDESTEGWLPLAGGGMANVSIRRRSRLAPEVKGHEYIIYGQRVPDGTVSDLVQPLGCDWLIWHVSSKQVILSCVINKELQYFKVMPTFHHWSTTSKAGCIQRNGLTFQTAADARAFDKGIVRAYDALLDGKFIVFIMVTCFSATQNWIFVFAFFSFAQNLDKFLI